MKGETTWWTKHVGNNVTETLLMLAIAGLLQGARMCCKKQWIRDGWEMCWLGRLQPACWLG